MPKKRLAMDEPQVTRPDSVEDILAKIATLNKREGIKSTLIPDTIYFYDLRRDGFDTIIHRRFHGKCATEALEKFNSIGYLYTATGHIEFNDLERSRTTCEHCNQVLNPQLVKKLLVLKEKRRADRKAAYKLEQAIQLERDKELALLGLL